MSGRFSALSLVTPRWRLRLTGLGGLLLLGASWRWGQAEMAQWSFPLGAVITSGGLLLRMWASGWLFKNKVLTTTGPYALTRNPLYLGTGLITLGQSFMSAVLPAPILFPALWLALYWPTMREEENYLAGRHGAAYEDYRRRVPLLLPRLWPRHDETEVPASNDVADGEGQRFSWRRMLHYHKGFIANALMIVVYGVLHATR